MGRSASPRLGDAGRPWRDNEDWALLEATPRFTVGDGENAATFWTALSTAGAELGQRTPGELQRRIEELAAEKGLGRGSYGGEPVVLSSWARMPDGRFTGSVDGRSVWLTVELEGRLKSDPRGGPGYIVSLNGRVYELGKPKAPEDTKQRSSMPPGLRSIAGYLSIALLSGGAGIYIGTRSKMQKAFLQRAEGFGVSRVASSARIMDSAGVPLYCYYLAMLALLCKALAAVARASRAALREEASGVSQPQWGPRKWVRQRGSVGTEVAVAAGATLPEKLLEKQVKELNESLKHAAGREK